VVLGLALRQQKEATAITQFFQLLLQPLAVVVRRILITMAQLVDLVVVQLVTEQLELEQQIKDLMVA
jgi:hypothetical protein